MPSVSEQHTKPKVCIVQYNASNFLTRVDRSARTLAEAGWEVVLVAIALDGEPAFEQRDGYAVRRVELASRRWPRWTRPVRWIEAVWRTYTAASAERADVYNPRDIYPMLVAQLAAWRRGAVVVCDSDELNLYRNWPWTRSWWWKPLAKTYEGFFFRRAAARITSDEGRADVIAREYGIARPAVVRNVPDVTEPPVPDAAFRAEMLGDARWLLIYQGGLVANRGLLELVEAMVSLPDCALVLLGWGHLRPALEARVAELGVGERVRVLDPVPYERMLGITAACDAGVIPIVGTVLSYVYAAPNKLFEDMACAVPVVASDLPDMAEVVRAERVGTLIADPTDPVSIVTAVRELLDGAETPAEVGARAQEAAFARHVWAVEQPRLLDVWDALTLRDGRTGAQARGARS